MPEIVQASEPWELAPLDMLAEGVFIRSMTHDLAAGWSWVVAPLCYEVEHWDSPRVVVGTTEFEVQAAVLRRLVWHEPLDWPFPSEWPLTVARGVQPSLCQHEMAR